jgi:neutral ceramidase
MDFETHAIARRVRRAPRNILRLAAGVAAVCISIAFLCLNGVDYRPYLRESYYAQTTARLKATAATNTIIQGIVAVGFDSERLTPIVNAVQDDPQQGQFRSLPLAGYGSRHGRAAWGTHDELYVKALAFRVGDRLEVIVSADALIIPPEVTEIAARRLKQELSLSREQIYLSATHTHSSLGGWGEGRVAESFAGGFQNGVRIWFADRIVTAVRRAIADLKPAQFGHGQGFAMFLAGGVGSHSSVAGANGFEGAERMGQALARAVLERIPLTALELSRFWPSRLGGFLASVECATQ